MKLPIEVILQEVIPQYNLQDLIEAEYIYIYIYMD